ncbi:MAG: radical SAM protein [Candidatus Omnitrophota bacterium]|nr:radical SAM protein [Candidatus Omnitrophota bacterium]
MRVLFIYLKPSADIRDPLGLLYLISVAKNEGHETSLLIPNLDRKYLNKAVAFRPDVICYSVTTGTEKRYLKINTLLKKRISFLSVFGGPHPTFYPEFIKEPGVDIICRGEGEDAFMELLRNINDRKDFSRIPNLCVKVNDQIIKNEIRPLADINNIAFPDRSLINEYYEYKNYGVLDVISGRGCPYSCTYCFNKELKDYYSGKGTYVRKRNIDNMMAELKMIRARYKIKAVRFVDDIFIIDKRWFSEFVERYKKDVNLPYCCHVRVDLVTESIAKGLKDSGCFLVVIGIESGSERLRRDVLKRPMSNEQIIKACALLKKYNIKFETFNMIGLPKETLSDAFETVELNVKCKPAYSWISIIQPYPGTELYRLAADNGLLDIDYRIEPDYHSSTPLKLVHKNEIINLHDLFAIAVQFPFLIPIIKKLIRLPRNRLFKAMFNAYKFYSYIKVDWVQLNYFFVKHMTSMFISSKCLSRQLKRHNETRF